MLVLAGPGVGPIDSITISGIKIIRHLYTRHAPISAVGASVRVRYFPRPACIFIVWRPGWLDGSSCHNA